MDRARHCPDCSSPATGRFCPACGLRLSGRLTLRTLGGEFFARFFGAESGLWPTLVGLTTRPGRTARAYLDGRRRRLLSPFALFVLCATAQMIGLWALRDRVTGEVIGSLPQQYFDVLQQRFGIAQPREWATDRYLGFVQTAYSWLGLFTFALPLAGVARLVMGRAVHFTELFAASLYTIGFCMLATAVTAQLTMRVSVLLQSVVSICIYLTHAMLTFGGCFGWRPRTVAAILAGLVVGMAGFLLSIGLLANLAFDPRFWR
ncbi:MAG: DUF3667 domain-containing protein [Planctomycetes bacterium]|nr:DUF3667 domain-containing protein [Planctomycetota bacterium]